MHVSVILTSRSILYCIILIAIQFYHTYTILKLMLLRNCQYPYHTAFDATTIYAFNKMIQIPKSKTSCFGLGQLFAIPPHYEPFRKHQYLGP